MSESIERLKQMIDENFSQEQKDELELTMATIRYVANKRLPYSCFALALLAQEYAKYLDNYKEPSDENPRPE